MRDKASGAYLDPNKLRVLQHRGKHFGVRERTRTSAGNRQVIGRPQSITDQLQHWFKEEGADGSNIMAPWLPGGLRKFAELVVPELQQRGLFRTEYEGRTLRENLGLPQPVNRHVQHGAQEPQAVGAVGSVYIG